MDVLLCGDFDAAEAADWQRWLQQALPEARWHAPGTAAPVTAAVVANPPPGCLQGLPGLRLIQSLWAGVDRLLADPTLPAGVPIARMVDPAMSAAMAETAVWAVLALQRDFFRYARQQRERRWRQHPQRRADECPVLVLGQGEMGGAASRALRAQGFTVHGWSRRDGPQALQDALPQTRVLINLLPLTAATAGLLNSRLMSALPRGAALVNLARGGHLVEADLLAALADGRLSHAVLDVFSHEPLPSQHPFWAHERITLLPHVAAQTDGRSAAAVVAANLRALRDGRPLAHLVSRERGY
jgi:glyoxylate/hydroxypyruvate reductase A